MKRALFALLTVLVLALPGTISAEDATPLDVSLQQEPAQFEEPFYSAFITAGENKFTFIIPQGFHLKDDPATGRLTLGNRNGDCSITFSIISAAPSDGAPLTVESCRALLQKRHPEGKILSEFSTGVAGRSGPAFDVQWKAAENIYQCERIGFVATPYGLFMFSATSGKSKFPAAQGHFGLVTGSFRVGTDGKFRPAHILGVN